MSETIDVLILNRNLRSITDGLVRSIVFHNRNAIVGVIDAGSRKEEKSDFTVVSEDSKFVAEHGLRINRGYNLGIKWWLNQTTSSDWLLLLPNDSEVVAWDANQLLKQLENLPNAVVVIPIAPTNPYITLLGPLRLGLGWNFHEGPILLKRSYLESRTKDQGFVFDEDNFRSYLSFIELSMQVYGDNRSVLATDLISFIENESHLLSNSALIQTESYSENLKLLVIEGEAWLRKKYGWQDRWPLEMATRALFERYLVMNPSDEVTILV
jgi:hypothetical protein